MPAIEAIRAAWGQRLRTLREQRGMSGAELARRAGIHRNHLSRIENGDAASDEVRVALAAALDVPTGQIFDYDATPTTEEN